ncbi:unnamed protein product, partial [Brachionus calyciflorus]
MEEIFEKVLEFISIYGAPVEWLSDKGKEFVNELLEKLCKVFKINRRFTPPYNPKANGLTEIFAGLVHSSTNFSPYEILFGRKMNGV